METFLFDGPSVVLTASQQRTFTGKLRRAIQARDRRCQHPSGCNTPSANGDVDHIVPWKDGGTTDQFNGRAQCRPHNRHHDKHDPKCRWVYRRDCEHEDNDDEPAS